MPACRTGRSTRSPTPHRTATSPDTRARCCSTAPTWSKPIARRLASTRRRARIAPPRPGRPHRADRAMATLQLRRGRGRMSTTIVERDVALIDLVDRLLGGGVVIAGDLTLAVADVDLVYVGLRALVTSVATAEERHLLPQMGDAA